MLKSDLPISKLLTSLDLDIDLTGDSSDDHQDIASLGSHGRSDDFNIIGQDDPETQLLEDVDNSSHRTGESWVKPDDKDDQESVHSNSDFDFNYQGGEGLDNKSFVSESKDLLKDDSFYRVDMSREDGRTVHTPAFRQILKTSISHFGNIKDAVFADGRPCSLSKVGRTSRNLALVYKRGEKEKELFFVTKNTLSELGSSFYLPDSFEILDVQAIDLEVDETGMADTHLLVLHKSKLHPLSKAILSVVTVNNRKVKSLVIVNSTGIPY